MMIYLQKILKLCVPPILFTTFDKLKCEKNRNRAVPLLTRDMGRCKLFVIGNGPSLNVSFAKYKDILCQTECLMVNESVLTMLYDTIKPAIYMLVDPKYYEEKGFEWYQRTRDSVIEALVSKTKWKMIVVMPYNAQNSYAARHLKDNNNIELHFFWNGWERPKEMSLYEAWDKNLVAPPGQTVLNTAIWLSIYWNYKETYIIGADTSWHAQLQMDQETNELYTEDTHFFDNGAVYGKLYDSKKNRRPIRTKLHEELFAVVTALKSYWELRGYADWKGVKIYNASESSWIDAFERRKLQ